MNFEVSMSEVLAMSGTYKTVIHISSSIHKPLEGIGSDPQAYGAAKLRKENSPSNSKHSTPTEHIDIGQPCLVCGQKCPGYMQHVWRKQCLHCSCARSVHSIETDLSTVIPQLEQLTVSGRPSKLTKADIERLSKYAWYPTGVSYGMVEKYMQSLPAECVPVLGTEGESYRRKQCYTQIPLYDFSLDACHKMSDLEKKRFGKLTSRREESFGVGTLKLHATAEDMACAECLESITMGSVYIASERAGPDKRLLWHPQCFRCNTCRELLVDLVHYRSPDHEGLYCGRHYLELLVPRCAGCDEMILSSQYTEADGKNWHKEHYCCTECDSNISGKPHTSNEGAMLCERCYNKYASKCHRCKEPISLSQKQLSVKGKQYHKTCFVCKRCREELVGEQYFIIDDDIVCPDCIKPIGQCQGCKEGISPSVSYLQHGDRKWHAECFKCNVCRAWLVNGEFLEMASSLLCKTCYVEKMSLKCEACNRPISEKGIKFALKSYHIDCFVCTGCRKPLVGQSEKVKEKDGEPYCQSCISQTYKKCYKCKGAINTRHTVYKGHSFHLQCFQCNKCGRSIGSGEFFETSLGEIMCPRCVD